MTREAGRRGLSDQQLTAMIESLPEGLAIIADGRIVWANRLGRRLGAWPAAKSEGNDEDVELGELITRFAAQLPPFRGEEHARWSLAGGLVVEVGLRRLWGAQTAVRMSPPPELARAEHADEAMMELSSYQLLLLERLLEESAVGLVVTDDAGHIEWLNTQAHRMLGAVERRLGVDAGRDLARAARHVARGQLTAPVRTRLALPTHTVAACFWSVAPGLAGVLLSEEAEEVVRRCVSG